MVKKWKLMAISLSGGSMLLTSGPCSLESVLGPPLEAMAQGIATVATLPFAIFLDPANWTFPGV